MNKRMTATRLDLAKQAFQVNKKDYSNIKMNLDKAIRVKNKEAIKTNTDFLARAERRINTLIEIIQGARRV